jgi:hypothetical protein
MTRDTGWFKSSFSAAASDECVEVQITHKAVHIRDTKSRDTGTLRFGPSAWAALIADHSDRVSG